MASISASISMRANRVTDRFIDLGLPFPRLNAA
jgi:hypothetical protein